MAPPSQKKRQLEEGMRGTTTRPKKRIRKQREYHSSSDESEDNEFTPINLNESDTEVQAAAARQISKQSNGNTNNDSASSSEENTNSSASDSSEEEAGSEDEGHEESVNKIKIKSKRNDPDAFATSMSKILSAKLPQSARKDPVLSRSRDAKERSSTLANERLENKAKSKLRADKKHELERGRVKDVLGLESGQSGEIAEEEKRLRRIAQRGVVKLFNAVRAAQVKAEEVAREERSKGTIGTANREEKANEMSKQGFLDLISGRNKVSVEEA